MKKVLSVLLAVVMLLALAMPAFAADDITSGSGSATETQPVTATYEDATTSAGTVYYVTISWQTTENTLKYKAGNTAYTWDGATMKYQSGSVTGNGWEGTAKVQVTVTNQSNAEITANASWAQASGLTVACSFDNASVDVESAAKDIGTITDGATGAAQTKTITATIAAPTNGTISSTGATVGTITVSIAPKA